VDGTATTDAFAGMRFVHGPNGSLRGIVWKRSGERKETVVIDPVELEISGVELGTTPCRTRLPFRFGIATLTEAPLLTVRVHVRGSGGGEVVGHSGDLLVPKWFDKNPNTGVADDTRALVDAVRSAARALKGRRGSAFSLWREAGAACALHSEGVPLVRGFGVAQLERALIDATCRIAGLSFRESLAAGRLGFQPGAIYEELAGADLADLLTTEPAQRLTLRHTVGLLDDLERGTERPDALPVALSEDIERYGLDHFKVKVAGPGDHERLLAVARVVRAHAPRPARFTLDGNEQFERAEDLAALLDGIAADPDGRSLLEGLLYIEQPLPRARSLAPEVADGIRALGRIAPVMIDEADATADAFPQALALGYRGVSVKACKGVFRALAGGLLCKARGDGAFQSSEDLTTLPIWPLHQDLALARTLGLSHSERNGHHYFRGLAHLAEDERIAALDAHGDLYEADANGEVFLRIRGGVIDVGSLDAVGFGTSLEPGARESWERVA
jgi:L-alanine-DL-glutamate epimerase-like enolase superfamily enzyme